MRLTFRARLTFWYVAVLGCLLALVAMGLLYALNRVAQKKFDAALWMLGAAEAENIAASLSERGIERPDDQTVINSKYRRELGYEDGKLEKYVTVVDDERRVADYSTNLAAPLPFDEASFARSLSGEVVYQTVQVDGLGSVRVVYMPVRGPSIPHPFVVLVGLPEAFVVREVRSFNTMVALALVTLVCLTGASAMLLAERAIRPVEQVTDAVESISALSLKTRLPEPEVQDQIGRLVTVLNRMLARLDAAFEAQHLFASRAAHELRTPLTILKGEAQVALVRERTVAEYQDLLKSNLEEVEKLTLMIEKLLLLARYEGGERDVPHEPVRLDEIAAGVVSDLRPMASDKGIDLRVGTEELEVRGDPQAIERLVRNLIENALTYTPGGGRVSVGVALAGGRVNLVVEDTGIGIAPEELPHIFQCFYRSSAAGEMRPEGSGIGLPLSADIARLHRAAIDVTSEPGRGTRFVVSFPRPA
jgi:two-component system OmpR family sensor kinase